MGGVGKDTSKSNVIYDIQTERLDYYGYRDGQKEDMKEAIEQAKKVIDYHMNDNWFEPTVEGLYERLADEFPRHMDGDEAEKVMFADKEYITTMDFSIWEDRNGKLNVSLEPNSYSIDEFNEAELEDMGIDKQYLRERKRK